VLWARHLILSVPVSTQVYKWVPVNLRMRVALSDGQAFHPKGVETLLVASCYRNRDKFQPEKLLGSYADSLELIPEEEARPNVFEPFPSKPPA